MRSVFDNGLHLLYHVHMRFLRLVTPAIKWQQVALAFTLVGVLAAWAHAEEPGSRWLYLIRHGFYDYHDERDPEVGKALVPLGVAQARLTADRLRSLPVRVSSLRSSTMTRAYETALVIGEEFPDLQITKHKQLSECTPPTWREDIMAEYESEELSACRDKLETAFAEFFVPSSGGDRHDVVVCHGNVIRYFVTRILGVDTLSWLVMSVGNCSLTVVRINPDGTMKLLSVGDVGHLPPNLQTGWDDAEPLLVVPQD
jgi:serine/threonine-protein phosphatase PGAM5